MEARYFVCPLVWHLENGKTVAVFVDREKAEAVVRAAPDPPDGGWQVFPMIELEVLGWLREQRAEGVSQLLMNPDLSSETSKQLSGYCLKLSDLLDSGKTTTVLRHFADRYGAGGEDAKTNQDG